MLHRRKKVGATTSLWLVLAQSNPQPCFNQGMSSTSKHKSIHKSCSFCQGIKSENGFLAERPRVAICDSCIRAFSTGLEDVNFGEITEPFKECSFCCFMKGMPAESLRWTVQSKKGSRLIRHDSKTSICDDCLVVCSDMVNDYEKGF